MTGNFARESEIRFQIIRRQKIELRFELWKLRIWRLPDYSITKKPGVSKLPVMPNEFGVCMVYGRCCTGCDGARQAWVSRHFCLLGNFLESWVSLWFSAYADFFTFPEKVKGERRYPFWIPAFHSCISYGHLGNIWNAFCQTASLFMSLYYINTVRWKNEK